ncbi:DUF871 domain-containing protein [Listeria aquatica]|uniref:DUF871 domain-containing protein n=1 Tax=Listeria aquatica TaxID=1494960 RepID=A0A841ZNB5_9LIST|nr:MupG family TIM beta-alpha barrel fold protein [Listeria aquatica]MBC1522169.1 DUF871 domain-containing protein [Listeria aquatica]
MLGISLYLQDLDNVSETVQTAHQNGFSSIFSSLHIPEESKIDYRARLEELGKAAQENNMTLILDISENALKKIQLSFENAEAIHEIGVTGLRIDYGIGIQQIALLSQKVTVYLNASTIDQPFLDELKEAHAHMENIEAFHNYYPKPETGLSEAFFNQKNHFLHGNGLKISAFVPGDSQKRLPLYAGLPTLEKHRFASPYAATLELFSLAVDHVYIGDPALDPLHFPFWQNLAFDNTVSLEAELADFVPTPIKKHLIQGDQNRMDDARDLIRLEKSRICFNTLLLAVRQTTSRPVGTITIDNQKYGRYSGEICITKVPLEANEKINCIGQIKPSYLDCLPYISAGQKIKLRFNEKSRI